MFLILLWTLIGFNMLGEDDSTHRRLTNFETMEVFLFIF